MRKPLPRILTARLADFTGGLNLRDDTFQLAPNELADTMNMRVMPSGGMRQRKTLTKLDTHLPSIVDARALWTFYGNGVNQMIVQDGNDARYSTSGDGWTLINPDALTLTGKMRSAVMHRVSVASSERLYIQRNAEQVAWKWDGSSATVLADVVGHFNDDLTSPAGGYMPVARYICAHAGFMFHAYTVESGTTHSSRVRFSQPGEPEDYRTNDYIDVGVDDGDAITGLASVGAVLYIFKTRSIWRLTGYDSTTFQLARAHNSLGAVSQEAISVTPLGVYFFDQVLGVHLIDLSGRLEWLWQKLYCKLTDGTIAQAYLSEITFCWFDNRVWVSVPYGGVSKTNATSKAQVFVFDPACGKNGAWYVYQYGSTSSVAPIGQMATWRTGSTTPYLLAVHLDGGGNQYVVRLEYDESSVDVTNPSSLNFSCWFTTAWFNGGLVGVKKQWKRPSFIVNCDKATTINLAVYGDYNTLAAKKSATLTIAANTGGTTLWGHSTWGGGTWGASALGNQVIVKATSLGNLHAIQLRFSCPTTNFFALDGVEFRYVPQRYT